MTAPVSDIDSIESVARFLHQSKEIGDKIDIRKAYSPAIETLDGSVRIGDDCAAIPDGAGGYLLLAGEAMLEDFVADDPWFAGYSAVMVNISDICAMGGTPTAIVDMLWSPGYKKLEPVWEGLRAAAEAYAVPIVGGHTTITGHDRPVGIAAGILGRAKVLMTSFTARPGQQLLMAVDLDGTYRGDKPFWNASVDADSTQLRRKIGLLRLIAEKGWSGACRDISNGGIIGTLIMLLGCSGVGARLFLDALPRPPASDLQRWLISFPSYGFLFASSHANSGKIISLFGDHNIECRVVGEVTEAPRLELSLRDERYVFWSDERQES